MKRMIIKKKKRNIRVHNKKLIQNAFVHSSYVNEHKLFKTDNERLEFMGDAVLQMWSAEQQGLCGHTDEAGAGDALDADVRHDGRPVPA